MARGESYEEFIAKFDKKAPKTTDDCYTPRAVYEGVSDYVAAKYGVDSSTFCRPFYPGGDYENYDYNGKVVVDNPPFSCLAKICRFYEERGIPFFLFAPALTVISSVKNSPGVSVVFAGGTHITYENGAKVCTAFVTNMEKRPCIRASRALAQLLLRFNPKSKRKKKPRGPNVYSSADLNNLSKKIAFNVSRETSPVQIPQVHYGDAIVSPELIELIKEAHID